MDTIDSLIKPLKPTLQIITNNLPSPLQSFAVSLLGDHCTATLLRDLDLSNGNEACIKLGVSKALGIAIISASAIVKLPQILKLLGSGSATGLSFTSYVLESASYVITLAYSLRNGFPFSTYGETAFIAIQDIAIANLILNFSGKSGLASIFSATVVAALYVLLGTKDLVSNELLKQLQLGAGFLGIAAKVPQIWTIYRQGTTGQLSAFAVFNYLFGSLSRIYTTIQEVDDPLILYGFIAGFALNAILAAQMIYYWNNSKPIVSRGQKSSLDHIRQQVFLGVGKDDAGQKTRPEALDYIKEKAGVASTSGVSPKNGPTTRRRG